MALLLVVLAVPACPTSGVFRNGIYTDGRVRYRVGELPAEWRRVDVTGNHVALHHPPSASTISANAICGESDDPPLKVLAMHLFIGLTEKRMEAETLFELDGREALRTVLSGKLDGVPLRLVSVVVKKDGCVFDFVLTVLRRDASVDVLSAFQRFVGGFKKLPRHEPGTR